MSNNVIQFPRARLGGRALVRDRWRKAVRKHMPALAKAFVKQAARS